MAVYGYDRYGLSKYGGAQTIDFGVDPFTAVPLDYDTVELNWTEPSGDWHEFRILRSRAGYAITENDGVLLYATQDKTPGKFVDNGLTGGWYYYTVYIYNTPTFSWERAASIDVLVPYDFSSTEKLWTLLPHYYRTIRSNGAGYSQNLYNINPQIYLSQDGEVENEDLFQFLLPFGWGTDILRSQAETTLDGYDTNRVHLSRLALLAEQFGTSLEPAVPAHNNRNLVRNLGQIYRKRGTLEGIKEMLALATGWDVDIHIGPNIMLNRDQSAFISPQVQDWDPGTRYVPGDVVRYGQWFRECIVTAFGYPQAPADSPVDNTWWNSSNFIEPKQVPLGESEDTGNVGTWQVEGKEGLQIGGTAVGLGVPDPLNSEIVNSNAFVFQNNTSTLSDMVVRSIPKFNSILQTDPFSRHLVLENGIQIPQVFEPHETGRLYPFGHRVLYNGRPYEAKTETNLPPTVTTDWKCLGTDQRVRLNASFYAHGPFSGTAGSGGVPVRPWLGAFDEKGDLIQEIVAGGTVVTASGTPNTTGGATTGVAAAGGAVYDSFGSSQFTNFEAGRTTEQGGATWVGFGSWDLTVNGYAYPLNPTPSMWHVDTGRADGSLGVMFAVLPTNGNNTGLLFRWSDNQNYWEATQTGLYKVVNGTRTNMLSFSGFGVGDRVIVKMAGSTITALREDTVLGTVTDTFNSTATNHGIMSRPA